MGGWGCATAPLHVSQKTWASARCPRLGKCEQWHSLDAVVWDLPSAPSGSRSSLDFSVPSLLLVMQKLKLAHSCLRRICFQYRCTFHVFLGESELSIQHAVILDLPPRCSHFLTSKNILWCEHIFSICLVLLGHIVISCLTAKLFSTVVVPFYIPTNNV